MREGDVLTRRYRLLEQIASGGMSAIWRAFDQSLHRTVAIKVLDGSLGGDQGGRELIRREARATARLIHPDAIEVYDYGETVTARGRLAAYVVMRLLDGRPLSERILEGPLPWREAATIGARVATVLAAAHQRGIVHRDVTAENVLLTPEGAKLLDFGIAAFVGEPVDQALADFGTPPYVAPERLTGASVHPAVDVYALGVLLHEMLTGLPPYPETTWEAVEAADRRGPPPAPTGVPDLPSEIAALCAGCLAEDPADRPGAQHVADILTAALNAPAIPGRETAVWIRRVRRASVAAAALSAWTAALLWINPDLSPPAAAVDARSTGAATPGGPSAQAPHTARTSPPVPTQTTHSDPSADTAAVPRTTPTPTTPAQTTPTQTTLTEAVPTSRAVLIPPSAPTTPGTRGDETGAEWAGEPTTDKVPTLTQAVGRFKAAVSAGEAAGDIRTDVALDLRQVVGNLLSGPAGAEGLMGVRRKLEDRSREGALSPDRRRKLEHDLDIIDTALRHAS
ncbi:serine/threonine protein kinase [Sphaerisporangium album]|uniref:non-specific serine/threonine protein kinase n=2 Tax=Sphaerisporangium album TaxID=509200 RepID=A0A367FM12_9ACTN|nr:serine/threonine protein kinase [Sphaerisporangium album]